MRGKFSGEGAEHGFLDGLSGSDGCRGIQWRWHPFLSCLSGSDVSEHGFIGFGPFLSCLSGSDGAGAWASGLGQRPGVISELPVRQ